jgi:hypothetical protein
MSMRVPLTFLIGALALASTNGAEPSGGEHSLSGEMAGASNAQTNSTASSPANLALEPGSIWENGVGAGFRPTTQSLGLSAGATGGLEIFGSRQAHDLALVSLAYGHMLGPVRGADHWYHGNAEFRLELFTGSQFSPNNEWFVGLTPHLRYHFATGTRWVPFVDAGMGVTATGIGPPDLSGTFEFNLQAGGGVQWFITDKVALSLDTHYVHWSCAGINQPNLGLNGFTGLLGVTVFF